MACLSVRSSWNTIATIDNNGIFYLDREGREPSQSFNIHAETQTDIWVRVPFGDCEITIAKGMGCITHIINWQSEADSPKIDRMDLNELPPVLEFFHCPGYNCFQGNIKDLPSTLYHFLLADDARIEFGRGESHFNDSMNYFNYSPNSATPLTQDHLDSLIIELSHLTWSGSDRELILQGSNPPRTPASDTAVQELLTKNVQIDIKS